MERLGGRRLSEIDFRLLEVPPGGRLPVDHTKDGADSSPALSWKGLPEATKSIALLCEDPDAPGQEPWVHWILFNVPVMAKGLPLTGLPRGLKKVPLLPEVEGARQGVNSFGEYGYGGPQPPRGHGLHHYVFRLYALDDRLNLREGAAKPELLHEMEGHVLATSEAVGTYSR